MNNLILKRNRAAALEYYSGESGMGFRYVEIKERNGSFDILKKEEGLSIDDLKNIVQVGIPLRLIWNQKGIIRKETKSIPAGVSPLELIFPDTSADDFIWEKHEILSGSVISVSRRDKIDALISELESIGIFITGVSLAPFSLNSLSNVIQEREILCPSFTLTYNGQGQLISWEKANNLNKDYKIGEEEIGNQFLIPLSGAIEEYLQVENGSPHPSTDKNKENIKYSLFSRRIAVTLVPILLFFTLLSLFSFRHFENKNQDIRRVLSQRKAETEKVKELESKLHSLENNKVGNLSKTSFYADRIAAVLPKNSNLKTLNIFPLRGEKRDYRNGEMPIFLSQRIDITGTAKSGMDYREFSRELERFDWVKEVVHVSLTEDRNRVEFECSVYL